jgi:DNA-binding XRE family transcriptional regulator
VDRRGHWTDGWVKDILKLASCAAGGRVEWEILMTEGVEAFLDALYETDRDSHRLVNQAILVLERNGPAEGRPLVDTVTASRLPNMKELRPPSAGRTEIRILFVFDPYRSAVLLVAGDKSGQWNRWYRTAIPEAERLYEDYLDARKREAGRAMLDQARGWRLAELRKRRGLTQAEVAARMDVSTARVSQIENGDVSTQDVLQRYVTALGGTLKLIVDFGDEQLKIA